MIYWIVCAIWSTGLAGCIGETVGIYSAPELHESSKGLDAARLQARSFPTSIVSIETGMLLPFTPKKGSIHCVRVEIDGLVVQPYLIGDLYDGLFSAVILISNHSNRRYRVPINEVALQSDLILDSETHWSRSPDEINRALKDVIVEKCRLTDWEAAVNAETKGRTLGDGLKPNSNTRDLKLLVGGLFQQAETYELSSKETQAESLSSSSDEATSFYVDAGQCARVMASFDSLIENGEGGLLELAIFDMDTKKAYRMVFVLAQTMWARRIIY